MMRANVYKALRWFDRHCVTFLVLCMFAMVISLGYQVYEYHHLRQSYATPASCVDPPSTQHHPEPIQELKPVDHTT